MMQESPDPEDDESPSQSDLSMLSQDLHALKRSGSNTSCEDRECLPGGGGGGMQRMQRPSYVTCDEFKPAAVASFLRVI